MWGRWQVFGSDGGPTLRRRKSKPIELPEKDRRERARIVVEGAAAILLSAPIFNVGEGDPYDTIEILGTLGPDALPYRGPFNRAEFLGRLLEYKDETIGAALLNQRIVAGLGNYLRAEILFNCKLNPWLTVGELTRTQLHLFIEGNSTADTRCIQTWCYGRGKGSRKNGKRSVARISARPRIRYATHGLSTH